MTSRNGQSERVADVKSDVISLSDYVYERTQGRLNRLTDAEYLWEPVPGCWTIRRRDRSDRYWSDLGPRTEIDPFTTIAWRLWHLTGCYGAARNAQWLGHTQGTMGFESLDPSPATAGEALDALDRAHACWRNVLVSLPVDAWSEPLGAIAGPYADNDKLSFVLHQLDEQIHHSAEVAVLRDLYRAMSGPAVAT